MSEIRKEQESILEDIRHYLALHPSAADTPEGVVKWWLSKKFKHVSTDKVHPALELLVKQGFVKITKSLDGKDIYSRAL